MVDVARMGISRQRVEALLSRSGDDSLAMGLGADVGVFWRSFSEGKSIKKQVRNGGR